MPVRRGVLFFYGKEPVMAIVYGDYPLKKKTNSSTVSGSGSQSSYDRRNGTADERYTPTVFNYRDRYNKINGRFD